MPETIADWEEVLTVFRDVYHCEAPLMIASKTGYDSFHHFISAYGVLGDFYNDNGTVKYGPLEEGCRQWVELFRKWYAEGLLDPNFINNDARFRLLPEYMATGRAGASATLWGHTANALKTMGYELEEDFWIVGAPSPVLQEGDTPQVGRAMSEETKETVVITNNCKDVELAARWLDQWYTVENMRLVSIGIEGESYVSNGDGTYSLTDGLKKQVEDREYASIQDALTAQYCMSGYAFVESLKTYGIEDCIAYKQAAFDRYQAR